MAQKITLTILLLLLLVIAGGLITGGFDINPVVAIPVALAIFVIAAWMYRKGKPKN